MSYTAFISYNTSTQEEVFIYRLQTLASASDVVVLLPQRIGNRITGETKLRIDKADIVIAFITSRLSTSVREELAYAEGKKKLIIPIYEKGISIPKEISKLTWIEYDPQGDTPGMVEGRVIDILKTKKKQKDNKDALILIGLGLALLALIAPNK